MGRDLVTARVWTPCCGYIGEVSATDAWITVPAARSYVQHMGRCPKPEAQAWRKNEKRRAA